MPIYDYQCQKCGCKKEVIVYNTMEHIEKCEKCGADMKKIPSLSSFYLKGQCWSSDGYTKEYSAIDHAPK